MDGESFQNTSWVNYFDTDSVDIGNLSPELYEFKTVARNDYPNIDKREESPASDVVEGRPLPGVVSKFLKWKVVSVTFLPVQRISKREDIGLIFYILL